MTDVDENVSDFKFDRRNFENFCAVSRFHFRLLQFWRTRDGVGANIFQESSDFHGPVGARSKASVPRGIEPATPLIVQPGTSSAFASSVRASDSGPPGLNFANFFSFWISPIFSAISVSLRYHKKNRISRKGSTIWVSRKKHGRSGRKIWAATLCRLQVISLLGVYKNVW